MNVTSLELSKELYDLSGWNKTDFLWVAAPERDEGYVVKDKTALHALNEMIYQTGKIYNSTFAYDLGYILEKLPLQVTLYKGVNGWTFNQGNITKQNPIDDELYKLMRFEQSFKSDKPEEAAGKFAIELFKRGILKKEIL